MSNKFLRVPYGLSVHGKEEIKLLMLCLKTVLKWVRTFMNLKEK